MENTTVFNASFNNVSRNDRFPYDFYAKIRYTSGVMIFLLSPVIIVLNLALIITILTNPNLRKRFRHQVMISIALADLLIGLISCPVRGDILLKRAHGGHSCATYLVFSVIEEYVQMFVATWGIVTINFEQLFSLFRVHLPKVSPLKEKLCVALILALPWLAMVFIVLPVAYAHAREDIGPFYRCRLYIPYSSRLIVGAFTFAIPSIVIVSQSITMTVYHCLHKNNRTPTSMSSTEITTSPWVFVVAGVVTVVMVGLEETNYMTYRIVPRTNPIPLLLWFFMSLVISDAKSAATPLVWFAFQELRNAFMDLLKKLPRRLTNTNNSNDDTAVKYRNLNHDSV